MLMIWSTPVHCIDPELNDSWMGSPQAASPKLTFFWMPHAQTLDWQAWHGSWPCLVRLVGVPVAGPKEGAGRRKAEGPTNYWRPPKPLLYCVWMFVEILYVKMIGILHSAENHDLFGVKVDLIRLQLFLPCTECCNHAGVEGIPGSILSFSNEVVDRLTFHLQSNMFKVKWNGTCKSLISLMSILSKANVWINQYPEA